MKRLLDDAETGRMHTSLVEKVSGGFSTISPVGHGEMLKVRICIQHNSIGFILVSFHLHKPQSSNIFSHFSIFEERLALRRSVTGTPYLKQLF